MLERAAMDLLETRWPRLLLVAFCLLTWLPGLFTLPPTDRDESRFAQASKQMIETGDYVRIMNGDEPRNRKPIGIYWAQAPFAALVSDLGLATENPIWPYRIPSLLGGLVAVLATYECGRHVADRRTALLAAGMLAASVIVVVEVHLAKTDAALLGATTLAMGLLARCYRHPQSFGRGLAALFWLAVAAGVLLKGPITPMVVALTILTLRLADGRLTWFRALRVGWGLPLAILAVSPWFVAIGLATHGAFFRDAVGGDLGGKLASGDDAHGGPPGLHLLLLPLLALPAGAAVLRSIPDVWRNRAQPTTRFLLAWVVPSWIVFEAVPTKLPHYTLPLYPAIFLLAANWAFTARPGRLFTMLAQGLTGLAVLALASAAVLLPLVTGGSMWLAVPVIVSAGLVGQFAVRRHALVTAIAAMPLLTGSLLGWELPRLDPLWIAPRIVQSLRSAGLQGQALGSVGFHEPSLMFLAGTATMMLPTGQSGADSLAAGKVDALLVGDRDEAAFAAEAAAIGLDPIRVATIQGFNYSRGRFTTIGLYRRR